MEKQGFTITASTGPIDGLTEDQVESVAGALEKSRLQGGVVSADLLSRTVSIRAAVDVTLGAPDATLRALSALEVVFRRAGIDNTAIVELAVFQELAEDEFASARDDIVGTPEVAERLGISRQRVMQLVEQKGRFPSPVAAVRGTQVWRWGDIADWIAAGARDMRRKAPDNTVNLMDALKRKVAAERGTEATPRRAAAKRVSR